MDSLSRAHFLRFLLQDGPGKTVSADSHVHSFPVIAVAVIGILATACLLVSYYIFVIKCCLNWQRIDFLRRLSFSRRRETTWAVYNPGAEARSGLEEDVIRFIPVVRFKKEEDKGRSFCECAVCLNDFQRDEKLRIIPNCSHVFHIDCIDVWLQNNANCPLCRTTISMPTSFPSHSPQDPTRQSGRNSVDNGEDYVVIELGISNVAEQALLEEQERTNSMAASMRSNTISPSPRKFEHKLVPKKSSKIHKILSMGDECIDSRDKDDQFLVQPIRRSISMDSSGDRQLYLAVQEALQQQQNRQTMEGCSSRVRKSFFSFGYGNRSRTAVLPDYQNP